MFAYISLNQPDFNQLHHVIHSWSNRYPQPVLWQGIQYWGSLQSLTSVRQSAIAYLVTQRTLMALLAEIHLANIYSADLVDTLQNTSFFTFFPTVYYEDIRASGVVSSHPVTVASQHLDTGSTMQGTLTLPRAVCRLTPPIDPWLLTHDAVIRHVGE